MKKTFLFLLAFVMMGEASKAQVITVADVEALPGETVAFSVNLTGGKDTKYTAFQFDLQFPATGFNTTGAYTVSQSWTGASATVGSVDGTGLATVPFASANEIQGTDVKGLVTVSFTVDGSVALGEYDVTLKNMFLAYNTSDKDYPADVTFKVIVTDRKTLDENATTVPNALSGVNVKVKRTINANEWSTICLPFTMTKAQAEAAFGSDVVIKQYTNYTATIDENTLIPSAITLNFADYTLNSLRKLNAGTPYLIKTTHNIESFNVDNVTISEELNDVNGAETNYGLTGKFKGVLAKTTVPNNGLFISGNKFYYSKGNTKIKAFRGWFNLEAVLNVAASAPVFFSFDNETTSINMVKGERNISNGEVYNLNGHRVMSPNKGLFIKNGKKVIVK